MTRPDSKPRRSTCSQMSLGRRGPEHKCRKRNSPQLHVHGTVSAGCMKARHAHVWPVALPSSDALVPMRRLGSSAGFTSVESQPWKSSKPPAITIAVRLRQRRFKLYEDERPLLYAPTVLAESSPCSTRQPHSVGRCSRASRDQLRSCICFSQADMAPSCRRTQRGPLDIINGPTNLLQRATTSFRQSKACRTKGPCIRHGYQIDGRCRPPRPPAGEPTPVLAL